MSRWTSISADTLKAAGHGAIVDRAQTVATGDVDPVVYAISAGVARVRRAVSAGNDLDTDVTKIPLSLESVAVRLALYGLMERIGLSLSEDQRKTRDMDASDLNRLADMKIRVELPDTADPTLAPQNRGNWNAENKLIMRTHPTPDPISQYGPGSSSDYANPDGPSDQ